MTYKATRDIHATSTTGNIDPNGFAVEAVDPATTVCRTHGIEACITCVLDDYYAWQAEREARRRARKQAWRETPVHERFDLGGEG